VSKDDLASLSVESRRALRAAFWNLLPIQDAALQSELESEASKARVLSLIEELADPLCQDTPLYADARLASALVNFKNRIGSAQNEGDLRILIDQIQSLV
jgi:hypothetical protein